MEKLIFVGTVVTSSICEESIAGSIAGNNFQLNLIDGIEQASKNEPYVISLMPYPTYPLGKKIMFRTSKCLLNKSLKALLVPFVNLPFVKQISVSIAIFVSLGLLIWKNRPNKYIVLVYNVFSPFSMPVLFASLLFKCKCVAIIADLPFDDYEFKNNIHGLLQRLDYYVQTHIIDKFSGVIAITKHILIDFAQKSPSIVIEGGADISNISMSPIHSNKNNILLYSGALNEINGIHLLLDAFSLIENTDYCLWVFGDGPLTYLVKEAAINDKRIIYWGKVLNSQVKEYQHIAKVLINPRISKKKLSYYTFPSKIIEYMLSGTPVISTKLPGIPDEYIDYLIVLEQETPEALSLLIKNVCDDETDVFKKKGEKAQQFVKEKKSWNNQSKIVYNFVSSL